MSKRKRRKPFETDERPKLQPQEKLIDTTSGVFAFFRDYGVRETIESIIVAVVLALLFSCLRSRSVHHSDRFNGADVTGPAHGRCLRPMRLPVSSGR